MMNQSQIDYHMSDDNLSRQSDGAAKDDEAVKDTIAIFEAEKSEEPSETNEMEKYLTM